ncbi:MAG: S8 family serine peptidase [Planctomycetota bacterium]
MSVNPLVPALLCGAMLASAHAQAIVATAEFVPDQLIVRRDGARLEDLAFLEHAIGATGHQRLFRQDIWLLDLPAGSDVRATQHLVEGLPGVKYAHPNMIVRAVGTPNDPSFSAQWGFNQANDADIDAPEAWDIHTDATSVLVAVIDTGTQYTHPDLADNIWTNPGEIPGNGIDDDLNGYVDDVHGYDWVNNDGDPIDDHGHGTHTAGTVGARTNNAIGVAGVCWQARIMVLKFLSSGGSGSIANSILAVEYSMDNGAMLSSNSWGCYCSAGDMQGLKDAVDAAGDVGMLFVAAAGNSASNNDSSPFYPASFDLPEVFSIAASNAADTLASFSNYGAVSVDIAAPGESIYSTWPTSTYTYLSGTSMACPHAAGAVALVASYCPSLTMLDIKQQIMDTVDVKPAFSGKVASNGRLNLNNALLACPPPVTVDVLAPNGGELFYQDTATITWSSSDPSALIHHVTLRLQNGAGADLGVIADNEPNDGSYTWSCGAVADGSYRIRVDAVSAGGSILGTDSSDAAFRIDRSTVVLVLDPNGGELVHGAKDILWNATDPDGEINHVDLYLQDASGNDLALIASVEANDGVFSWDSTTVADGDYRIRIAARNAAYQALGEDNSDASFRVDNSTAVQVLAPNGGEALTRTTEIAWSTYDPYLEIVTMQIWLLDPDGSDLFAIATGEANDGSFTWDVSGVPMGRYLVSVRALDLFAQVVAEDRSDGAFLVGLDRTAGLRRP